jgi:hypothetical protein
MNGKGILYYLNENRFEGNFKKSLNEGLGTFFWSDGLVYDGNWNDGKIDGCGRFYEPVSMKFGVNRDVEKHQGINYFTYSEGK